MDKIQIAKQIVFDVIDKLNDDDDNTIKIDKSENSLLIGYLESLQVINLMTETEELMCDKLGFMGSLSENEAILSSDGPLKSVKTLIEYIVSIT